MKKNQRGRSNDALRWISENHLSQISGFEAKVLFVILTNCDFYKMETWVSKITIAKLLNRKGNENQIRRAIKGLISKGVLRRIGDGPYGTVVYAVEVPADYAEAKARAKAKAAGGKFSTPTEGNEITASPAKGITGTGGKGITPNQSIDQSIHKNTPSTVIGDVEVSEIGHELTLLGVTGKPRREVSDLPGITALEIRLLHIEAIAGKAKSPAGFVIAKLRGPDRKPLVELNRKQVSESIRAGHVVAIGDTEMRPGFYRTRPPTDAINAFDLYGSDTTDLNPCYHTMPPVTGNVPEASLRASLLRLSTTLPLVHTARQSAIKHVA